MLKFNINKTTGEVVSVVKGTPESFLAETENTDYTAIKNEVRTLKVISGGQTGIDRMALEVAKELGIPTGGTAAKGFRTEDGPDLSLKEFGLVESTISNYEDRTLKNIKDSDGTVLFGDMSSAGSAQTIKLLKFARDSYIINPTVEELVNFIKDNYIFVLNVAGNRASVLKEKFTIPQALEFRMVLTTALKQVNKL